MAQVVLDCCALPGNALEAAARFHADYLPQLAGLLDGAESLVIVMPPAPYDHADWRRAVARDLARAHAPRRVNVVGGNDAAATLEYLARAPGLTGQYLALDGTGAGDALG
ncbi:hypothetical protein LY632_11420 [Erythrobacter sp. SDW2]|uniref:Rossmann fold domain-containing protein n=1 Tax=Erythrobacter sp. SDW2 TaxID=2907154 RepID=UPI001F36A434|nr:hypothetical protein [Erythrobacter sp. SDW2]UIP06294.1 hypothetical protein LY632_11420 [Erythrobacter sp. SDW2]